MAPPDALNLITGKSLRVAYVYSLVVLVLMTLIGLASFQRRLEFMAVGNVVVGGLWACRLGNASLTRTNRPTPVQWLTGVTAMDATKGFERSKSA